jgi:hypothetical protein
MNQQRSELPDFSDWMNGGEPGSAFVIEDDGPDRPSFSAPAPLRQEWTSQPTERAVAEQPSTDNKTLKSALAHANRGHQVLPLHWPLVEGTCSCNDPQCKHVGKHPLTVHGLKDASINQQTISSWWERWPNANLGLLTGSISGLVVLDVDGDGGVASLTELVKEFGPLPTTTQSKTKRGTHFFFNYPKGRDVRGSVGKLGRGLDVRANGNYVVIAPSRYVGGHYEWTTKGVLADLPGWLLEKMIAATSSRVQNSGATEASNRIPEGRRNQTLTSLAGTMRKRSMTQDAIEAALLTENRNRCDPPLSDAEVIKIARSVGRYEPGQTNSASQPQSPAFPNEVKESGKTDCDYEGLSLPQFPDSAWRGLFANYRDAMRACSEASDVYNFLAFWTAAGNALGRRIYFNYGMRLHANVYGIAFGPTGDFKTSALRRAAELTEGAGLRVVRGVGSGEGISEGLGEEPTLFSLDEFTSLLRQGKWDGSTLLPTLTEIFDCPEKYEREYRKKSISLQRPVCSLLAGTTEVWFWRDVKEIDFEGGFGNRFIYLTGAPNSPIPLPGIPNLQSALAAPIKLKELKQQEACLEPAATRIWDQFYSAWRKRQFSPLEGAATKRIPAYVLKLAMTYAALEETLPNISAEQLRAALLVGNYAAKCVRQLIGQRFSGANAFRELEKRILDKVSAGVITKRNLHRALARHFQNSEQFNRVFEAMVRAGTLYTQTFGRGRVNVSVDPFD